MKNRRLVLLSAMLVFLYGCAQTIAMRGTPEVPAALGEAKVSKDDNGNTVIAIEVNHLAPPENLNPRKSVYVVWAQAPQGRTINLGQMTVGSNRVGEFRGVTPLHQFRILITAEDIPAVASPGKHEILMTDVFSVN